ncbi:MAG: valine--tRNA ligase [Deltaproteobacteria bacterium]|nr:valine--tRNA ligase [Deltaproteobacteria bacterium]
MDNDSIPKGYSPKDVEAKWYKYWEENGLFRADDKSDKPPFCIVIPPPNVTGVLHMGHALNNTLQDILCRYKRMKGFNVLWQPGTDHAGIATQNVVERSLAEEGKDRHTVGRDKFIEMVWEWRAKYGGIIINQLKKLGSSCDWSRERFTMDEGLSRAVKEVFVNLYEKGLIYRGDYIINWCPRCHTALADLEVEHEERDSFLYHIRYPYQDGKGGVVVATTRPETLLGDTAVAVNPDDERYASHRGLNVLLPILNRPIPIIFDGYVDKSFGTGALKVTPAHDANDFEIGNRHGLERIKVIDEDGRMNDMAGIYKGMDRFECREKILEDLKAGGLLEKVEPYRNATGHCYRCKTMIEPLLSKQWFVRIAPLAEKAVDAVKTGMTRIIPSTWENVYFDWMKNIRDWCISRQIWWGHRIPAWYCDDCGRVLVAKETPERCECGSANLRQETDVLDTWFSSALWPFSTLGWPDRTEALKTFYPTSTLITGFDILFFWVARMMMMGLHFMGDVPFRDVYIHALVRDAEGKKMSKSKGNVIDPLEVIEQSGTDAFRFTLAAFAAQGRDVKLSEDRIEGYRHFVNKIWNSSRFVLMNLDETGVSSAEPAVRSLPDRWILTRLGKISDEVGQALDDYRFNDAAGICYQFVWHEFCDWYIEMAKEWLYGEDKSMKMSVQTTLKEVLTGVLRLLHPFIPFVTEDIWQRMPGVNGSIMIAPFPQSSEFLSDNKALEEMELVMGAISGVRNIRGEMNIHPSKKIDILMEIPDEKDAGIIKENFSHIRNLVKAGSIEIKKHVIKPEASVTTVLGHNQIHVLLKGIIDFDEERNRIRKEIARIEKDMEKDAKKLTSSAFLDNAPDDIVEKVKEKVQGMNTKLEKLHKNLNFLEEIND